jgi:hypothetical protein
VATSRKLRFRFAPDNKVHAWVVTQPSGWQQHKIADRRKALAVLLWGLRRRFA